MGVATQAGAEAAMKRVAQAAIDEVEAKREARRSGKRRRKRPEGSGRQGSIAQRRCTGKPLLASYPPVMTPENARLLRGERLGLLSGWEAPRGVPHR
jgi:hypothetical protein